MSIKSQQYANLADHVYGKEWNGKKGELRHLEGKEITVEGVTYTLLKYMDRSSGYQGAIYQRKDTGEIVVAHRGTEFDRQPLKDGVAADGGMVLARANQQANDAIELTRHALDIAKKNVAGYKPPPEVTVTGHSLGGCLAQITAHKFHLRGETFNAYGAVSLDYGVPEGGDQVINHVMAADFVSAGSHHYGQVRMYATPDEVRQVAVLGGYNNTRSQLDIRDGLVPAVVLAGSHRMHHFLNVDSDKKPDVSVLGDPNAQRLAAEYRPMFDKYRNDIGRTRAGASLVGDGVQAFGEQQLRQAEQQQEMARQLRTSLAEAADKASHLVTKALHAAGQHQRHQAEQQIEANQQLRQGIAHAAGYVGQKTHEAMTQATATPSLYEQAKIGLPAHGYDHPIPPASSRAVQAEPPRAMPTPPAPEPTAPPQAQIPIIPEHLRDFRHPGHPLHGHYHEVLDAVHAMEDRAKIPPGPHSEQAAAVLTEQITSQSLTPRADWPFERFQRLGEVALRDKAIIAIEHQDAFQFAPTGREIRVPADQVLSRSVEEVSTDWTRRTMPHLHQPQVPLVEPATAAIDPRTLSEHDWRRPDHPRHGQYETLREKVVDAYAQAGVPRTEAQLDQATAAVAVDMQHRRMSRADELWLEYDAHDVVGPGSALAVRQNDGPIFNESQTPVEAMQQAPDFSYQQVQQIAMEQAIAQQQRQEREMAQGLGRSI